MKKISKQYTTCKHMYMHEDSNKFYKNLIIETFFTTVAP